MEREIDVSARHLVDWLKAGHADLDIRATREFLWDGSPGSAAEIDAELDAEDGIEVATTVGILEVRPIRGAGWVIRLRVENPLACHLPDEGSASDGPEEIGLDEFEACFLDDGEPDPAVMVDADRHADARAFDKVLAAILAGRRYGY